MKAVIRVFVLILSIVVGPLSLGQGAPPGGGGSTGGSGWTVTYLVTGTCIYNGWNISTIPGGGQVATPYTVDRMAILPQPNTTPNFSAAGAGTSYMPPGATQPTYLTASLNLEFKVKTTFTWTGQSTAPTNLKVAITSNALGQALYGPGTASADNGLGHPQQGGTSIVYPYGQMTGYSSNGTRYRKFNVSNGKVVFQTTIKATASGRGYISVSSGLSAAQTNWAVGITSDRGETFRRVVVNSIPKKVSNFLEDDEITSRGGDGKVYGDSVQSPPTLLNGNDWDFGTTFTMLLEGPWSVQTSGSHNVSPKISGGGSFSQLSEFFNYYIQYTIGGKDDTGRTLLTVTDTGAASDPVNNISDSCVYKMLAHLPAENKHAGPSSTSQFLHRAHESLPHYPVGRHAPVPVTGASNGPGAVEPIKVKYEVSGEVSAELGWEFTLEGGLSLPLELMELNFSSAFKLNGSITITANVTVGIEISVGAGQSMKLWKVETGTVHESYLERYGDQGYTQDSTEFEITSYGQEPAITYSPFGTSPPLP